MKKQNIPDVRKLYMIHVTNHTMERGGNNVGSTNSNSEAGGLYRTSGRSGEMGRGGTNDGNLMKGGGGRAGENTFIH